LVTSFSQGNVLSNELAVALFNRHEEGHKFDLDDLQILNAAFRYPNKYQRYQLVQMLPYIYRKMWASDIAGFAELAKRGPPVLRALLKRDPSMFVSFAAASQAWRLPDSPHGTHPGTFVLEQMLANFNLADPTDRGPWEMIVPLHSMIDLESDAFLDFMAHQG